MKPLLPQRTVVITGAAGTLGRAMAEQLLDDGWTVFGGWHRNPRVPEHPDFHPVALDVTELAAWEQLAARLEATVPHLDALIHNAGIARDGLLSQVSLQDWDETLATNVRSVAHGTRAVLPLLRQAPVAHILCVSSFASHAGGPGQSVYAASKAALNGLAASLARELASDGIRVNTLFPGALVGSMTGSLPPATRARLAGANLLGQLNDPAEVARFAAFLLSTHQISGQVFNLDSRIRTGFSF